MQQVPKPIFYSVEERLIEYDELSRIDVSSVENDPVRQDIVLYDLQNENADLQRDLKLVSMGIDEIVSAPSLKCNFSFYA